MVNLLFNCTTKPNSRSMQTLQEPNVVEVVLFEANPGYSPQDVEEALSSLNDVVKLYYGFVKRTTAYNGDGKYVDIVYWTDMKSAKDAAADVMQNQKAAKAFEVIEPESVQMYHFDAFNEFEE